ncbi:DUF5696 domain-containing protein [Paenibacillus sp. IITD108]|uniref:DUF5696 domain-containing protein n=1 Tax=Paenibacillus sp. IITD108 TaxID=3116649 RepID=UPI002F3F8B30
MRTCNKSTTIILTLLCLLLLATACTGNGRNAASDSADFRSRPTEIKTDPQVRMIAADEAVSPVLPDMDAVMENDSLRLYINSRTAEIAVLEKQSGKIWRSNPQGREEDSIATPYWKGKLSSQLSLVYLMHNGQTKEYDSYNDSVAYQQFEIIPQDSALTVTYRFGNPEKGVESIPLQLTATRFQSLLERLSDDAERDELKTRYRYIEGKEIWERREIPKAVVKRVLNLFEKMGYSEEELLQDNEIAGGEGATASGNPKFTASITYRLDGDSLVATVDTTQIREETALYRIQAVGMLEQFGAAGNQDDGYLFLPDGSGALMSFNNSQSAAQSITLSLYGEDDALAIKEKIGTKQAARLPVYGMKKNDAAFLANIEEGDGLARLQADTAGRVHGFHTIASRFVILPSDEVSLTRDDAMIKTPVHSYQGALQIRFQFLSGEQANYTGMAAVYREYLADKYGWTLRGADQDAPFYLELTGGFSEPKSMLGIPYEAFVPLSDLESANRLVDQLGQYQLSNIKLHYRGWFNSGLKQQYPSRIRLERALGSQKEWNELANKLITIGGRLYPELTLLQVYDGSKGFSPSRDAVQFVSRQYARMYDFSLATYRRTAFSHYLLAPARIEKTAERFLDQYADYGFDAISLRDLGDVLYSDFARGKESTRQDTKSVAEAMIARFADQLDEVMAQGGNAYALGYADHLLHVPQTSNGYWLSSESVPFYQIVLHGYIDYAGSPFNLADDQNVRLQVLKALESGSNVYYSWITQSASVLKDTEFSYLYAHDYRNWLDEAVQSYKEVNDVLRQVRGQRIIAHEKISERLYKTEFEQGVQIWVNYGDTAVTVDGVTIEACDYVVRKVKP